MKLFKVDHYEAGYGNEHSSGHPFLKGVAVTAATAALLGGLTACGNNSVMGDMEYRPEYDGNMSVESVSDSDIACPSSSSADDGMFTLDGDMVCVPSDEG